MRTLSSLINSDTQIYKDALQEHYNFCKRCLTFCDHALQPDDVRVVKLAHNRCLAQEVPPLTLHVSPFQCFYRYGDLLLSWSSQAPAAHLTELT